MDSQNKKIILIEDDTFIRDMFHSELDRAGFEVKSFGTGNDGLNAAKTEHFDLMLLDIMLPDTNGLEILKQLKSDSQTQSLKVVLLTNLGQDTIIREGFGLGAEGYLIKSAYNPDQIIAEVKNFLNPNIQPPTPTAI